MEKELTEEELLMMIPFEKYVQQYGPLKRLKNKDANEKEINKQVKMRETKNKKAT